MADIFLILVMVVAFFILLIVGVYLLVYYQHPDDHNDAYFPKAVVILGFVLAGVTVLLFPLDVANRAGYPGTFFGRRCLGFVLSKNCNLVVCPCDMAKGKSYNVLFARSERTCITIALVPCDRV